MTRHPTPATADSPKLRLCRAAAPEDGGEPESYKFPSARRPATLTLVAARVDRDPVERRFSGSPSPCAILFDPSGGGKKGSSGRRPAADITSSRDLVRQIESTLDSMQTRLTSFREQMDEAFKFPLAVPESDDQPRPRAA
jgi:hypothetical protein